MKNGKKDISLLALVTAFPRYNRSCTPFFSATLPLLLFLPPPPQVTHRDTVNMIGETTGAALITKGVYVPPGKQPPEGERKIYLLIEGPTELAVKHAKQVRGLQG